MMSEMEEEEEEEEGMEVGALRIPAFFCCFFFILKN